MHLEVRLSIKLKIFWHILLKDSETRPQESHTCQIKIKFGPYFHISLFSLTFLRPCHRIWFDSIQKSLNLEVTMQFLPEEKWLEVLMIQIQLKEKYPFGSKKMSLSTGLLILQNGLMVLIDRLNFWHIQTYLTVVPPNQFIVFYSKH